MAGPRASEVTARHPLPDHDQPLPLVTAQ